MHIATTPSNTRRRASLSRKRSFDSELAEPPIGNALLESLRKSHWALKSLMADLFWIRNGAVSRACGIDIPEASQIGGSWFL
jgi:hypothetical protein